MRYSRNVTRIHFAISISLQQTNTADMLDFAVDYIKELEKQVKVYPTEF